MGGAGKNYSSVTFPAYHCTFDPEGKNYMNLTPAAATAGWNEYSAALDMRGHAGVYNLAFMWNNDPSGGTQSPLAIDELSIEELTCLVPAAVTVSGLSSTSATLTYAETGVSRWQVLVDTLPFDKRSIPATPLYIYEDTVGHTVLAGLVPNTDYHYAVRAICAPGDTSAWTETGSLHTYCTEMQLPYADGFEQADSSRCWTGIVGAATAGSVARATTYKHSGIASLRIDGTSAVSPEFIADSLAGYCISGYAYCQEDSVRLGIGVIIDPNDGSTYEEIATVLLPTRNTWTEFTAYFTALSSPLYHDFIGARHVVITTGDKTVYLDDLRVEPTPACPKPTEPLIYNVTDTSFTLSFTDNAGASAWTVRAGGVERTYTTNPLTFAGLEPHTAYTVRVAAICSATDTSAYTTAGTIVTLCAPQRLPWSCGFEAEDGFTQSAGAFHAGYLEDNCWQTLNVKPAGQTYPYYQVTVTNHSGGHSLYIYSYKSTTVQYSDIVMMLPEFRVPAGSVEVNFWYRNGAVTATHKHLQFGYLTDPEHDTTFVLLADYPLTTTWTEQTVNTALFAGIPPTARLAFRHEGGDAATSNVSCAAYLDDITVSEVRSCSSTNEPRLRDVTSTTADIAFTDTAPSHRAWQYVLATGNADPDRMAPTGINGRVIALAGLEPATAYDLYVRAVCDSADVSAWKQLSFTTECVPYVVSTATPLVESFEGFAKDERILGCYSQQGDTNTYYFKGYTNTYSSATATAPYVYHYARTGEVCGYTYIYKSYQPGGISLLRPLHLTGGRTYRASIYVRAATFAGIVTLSVGQTRNVADMQTVARETITICNSVTIDGNPKIYEYDQCWREVAGYFSVPETGDYYLAVNGIVSGANSYCYLYYDDLSVTEFDCGMPAVTVAGLTPTSATINYTQADAHRWQTVVDSLPVDNIDSLARTPMLLAADTTGTVSLDSLTPNREYYYAIRSICGTGDTSLLTATGSFRTLCTPYTLPYAEDFEDEAAFHCWQRMPGTAGTVTRVTTPRHAGTAAMKLVSGTAISPELVADSLTDYMITGFAHSTTDNTRFDIGLITDPADPATYERFGTVTVPQKNAWTRFTVYFSLLADPEYAALSAARHVVITSGGATVTLDDLSIEPSPECPEPTEVSISNITDSGFSISFVDNARTDRWLVQTGSTSTVITSTSATITGLSPASYYQVRLAALCLGGDTSDFVNAGTVSTPCVPFYLPWVCGFEPEQGYEGTTTYTAGLLEGHCWNTLNIKPSGQSYPYYYINSSSVSRHSGKAGLYIYTQMPDNTVSTVYKDPVFIFPELADSVNNLNVEYWYKNSSTTTTYPQLEFGYVTNAADENSFVALVQHVRRTSWTQFTTNTAQYSGLPAHARLAIRFKNPRTYNSTSSASPIAYIDDIVVRQASSCAAPATVLVSSIGESTARVSFTDADPAHSSWEYVAAPAGSNPDALAPVALTADTFLLAGLTPGLRYEVFVRSVCSATSKSGWSKASFRTECSPYVVSLTAPYEEDFEDLHLNERPVEHCYTIVGDSLTYYAKAQINDATHTYSHSGSSCLYKKGYRNYMPNGMTLFRRLTLRAGTTYRAEVYARATTYAATVNLMYGTARYVQQMTQIATADLPACAQTTISGSPSTYNFDNCWQQVAGYFTVPADGDYYFAVNSAQSGTNTSFNVYIDDIRVAELQGCVPVTVAVDSIGLDSAVVSIAGLDSADVCQYTLVNPLTLDTIVPLTPVPGTRFVVSGLDHSTGYRISVRRNCGFLGLSPWVDVDFATLCAPYDVTVATPFVDSYETVPNGGQLDDCYNVQGISSTYNVTGYPNTTIYQYSRTGDRCLRFYGSSYSVPDGQMIMHLFNLQAGHTYRAAFYARATTYAATAQLLYGAAASNMALLEEAILPICNARSAGATSSYESCYQLVEAYFMPETSGEHTVAINVDYTPGATSFYVYVDDFTVEEIPSCATPAAAAEVASSTRSTITVAVPMGNKPAAQVVWAPSAAGTVPDSLSNSVITTTGTAVLTGLADSTAYDIRYRYICDSADVSLWSPLSRGTTMSTDCFEPQNLRTAGIVTGNHAAITWGPAPDAVGYEYRLTGSGVVLDSGTTRSDTLIYDSLASVTTYSFAVRTLCAADTTAWSTISFTTTMPVFDVPFVCSFEDSVINAGWMMHNHSGSNRLVISAAVACSGSSAMHQTTDGSNYSYGGGTSAEDAELLLAMEAGTYFVSYDWQFKGESSLDYARVFLVPYSTTIAAADLSYSVLKTRLPANAIPADNGTYLNNVTSWQHANRQITVPSDGVYRLVVATTSDVSAYGTPAFAIDNISVDRIACAGLASATVAHVADTRARVAVRRQLPSVPYEWGITTYANVDSVVQWTLVSAYNLVDTVRLAGLTPLTTYHFYARAVCDSVNKSAPVEADFTTLASAGSIPYLCDFESTAARGQWSITRGSAANYFMIGTAASTTAGGRALYVTSDGVNNVYNNGSLAYAYAYTPINFDAGTYVYSFQWLGNGESSLDFMRVFLLPRTTAIPDNATLAGLSATALPAGAISLDRNGKLNLQSSWTQLQDEFDVATEGQYNLVVAWRNDASMGSNPPAAIDDISITALTCARIPEADIAVTASLNTADIRVVPADSTAGVRYHVASSAAFADTLAAGLMQPGDSAIHVAGLAPGTRYYCNLSAVCDSVNESSIRTISFLTECAALADYPYVEDFEGMNAGSTYRSELADNCWSVTSSNASAYCYPSTSSTYVHGGAQGIYVYNSSTTGTVQTFALPKMDSLNGKTFSMWYRNYSLTSCMLQIGYLARPDDASSFVCLDTAPTSTVYAQHSVLLASLPEAARLAFRTVGTGSLNFDDIRVNRVVDAGTVSETLCFGTSYQAHGLNIAAGLLAQGDTTFTVTALATAPGVADSVLTINLRVLPEYNDIINDTACAGQQYVNGIFTIDNPQQSGTFFRRYESTTGCDSFVTLNLIVLPTYELRNDTICMGDVYTLGDTTITTTGHYIRVFPNTAGCLDTISVRLTVVDTAVVTTATICEGRSYSFEGRNYTTSGVYRVTTTGPRGCAQVRELRLAVLTTDSVINVTFCQGGQALVVDTVITTAGSYELVRVNDQNCDVVYHINATVTPPAEGRYVDDACEGRPYNGYGIRGAIFTGDTLVVTSTKTADLCDSLTYVQITFHPTQYSDTTATIGPEGYIEWHDNTYTEPGDYQTTLRDRFGCDSVVTLHLLPVGVDDVLLGSMRIAPNPVAKGQAAVVFTDNVGRIDRVEIVNSFGAVIDAFRPHSTPLDLRAPQASGVYHIRIITGDGRVFVEKLIVE